MARQLMNELTNGYRNGGTIAPPKPTANGSRPTTEQQEVTSKLLATLTELGNLTVKDDAVSFEGDRIQLPRRFSGDLPSAAKFLMQLHEQENTTFGFSRVFKFRPWDGAAAFDRACRRVFGTSGLGQETKSMFGSTPPQLRSIAVGPGQQLQVPWGEVSMPPLEAKFDLSATRQDDLGLLFALQVEAPRRNRAALEAFFDVVQNELEERSIYRGKAFSAASEPEFLDLSWIDSAKIVYTEEVTTQLEANVWSLLRHTEAMRERGMPLKRAVLLEGPYGTGKSLASALTAREAIANKWTFIQVRPGKDDFLEALTTARLYAPAVVQYEDIDTIAADGNAMKISELLDALDGIANKSSGVLLVATTNEVAKIQKAVMRPGRLDSIIHIGGHDRPAFEKLVRLLLPGSLLGDIDFDKAFESMRDFLPAFATEAVNNAIRYSMVRTGGHPDTIETEDLVNSATGLRRQLDLMNGAHAGRRPRPSLETAMLDISVEAVNQVVNGTSILDRDGDEVGSYGMRLVAAEQD
jgi:transitional endoplasmic reticulum ATPase